MRVCAVRMYSGVMYDVHALTFGYNHTCMLMRVVLLWLFVVESYIVYICIYIYSANVHFQECVCTLKVSFEFYTYNACMHTYIHIDMQATDRLLVDPSIYPSIHPSICPSVYLSIYLFIYLSTCLSIYLALSLSLCVSLSSFLNLCISTQLLF